VQILAPNNYTSVFKSFFYPVYSFYNNSFIHTNFMLYVCLITLTQSTVLLVKCLLSSRANTTLMSRHHSAPKMEKWHQASFPRTQWYAFDQEPHQCLATLIASPALYQLRCDTALQCLIFIDCNLLRKINRF